MSNGGYGAEEFLKCIDCIRNLRRGIRRRCLIATVKATDAEIWAHFIHPNREAIHQSLHMLRRNGWKIEAKKLIHIGSWRSVGLVDPTSVNAKVFRRERDKLKPFGFQSGFRVDPQFLFDLRSWWYGVRRAGAVSMFGTKFRSTNRMLIQELFKTLGLYDIGVRGMKYVGRPKGSRMAKLARKESEKNAISGPKRKKP